MNKRKYKYELKRVKKNIYIASTTVNIKVHVYAFAAKIITHQLIAVKHTFNFTSDSCWHPEMDNWSKVLLVRQFNSLWVFIFPLA